MRRMPPLSSLRAFEAAARHESFKLAASELGVTPTAISHQVRQLEADLGMPLFLRQTRKVVLTTEGRALFGPLRASFDTVAETVANLRHRPARRVATLSATAAFTARLLVPRVASFRASNPGWDLRLHASDEPVDLRAGEADAAIRYGPGSYPGLTALPLVGERFAPVCNAHMKLDGPEDLRDATRIQIEELPWAVTMSVPTWEAWAEKAGLRGLDTDACVSMNDESSAIQAVIAGQGVALLSLTLVRAELASGALIQPFGPVIEGLHYNLVFPTDAEAQPAVTVLRDWVMRELSKSSDRNA